MHTMEWIRRRRRRRRRWWWYDSDRSAVWSVSRAYIFALTLIMPIHTSTAATAYHIEFHYLIVEFWSSLVSNENIVRHAIAVRLCGVKCRSVFALTFVLHACNWLYTHTTHTFRIDAIVWCGLHGFRFERISFAAKSTKSHTFQISSKQYGSNSHNGLLFGSFSLELRIAKIKCDFFVFEQTNKIKTEHLIKTPLSK